MVRDWPFLAPPICFVLWVDIPETYGEWCGCDGDAAKQEQSHKPPANPNFSNKANHVNANASFGNEIRPPASPQSGTGHSFHENVWHPNEVPEVRVVGMHTWNWYPRFPAQESHRGDLALHHEIGAVSRIRLVQHANTGYPCLSIVKSHFEYNIDPTIRISVSIDLTTLTDWVPCYSNFAQHVKIDYIQSISNPNRCPSGRRILLPVKSAHGLMEYMP